MIENGWLEHDGLRFPTLEQGEGEPVILIHGFADGPETWKQHIPVLAEAGYRAVALTNRGYAQECLSPHNEYHAETLAQDVLASLDAMGVPRAHLVGHDWGATISYAATALAPERVTSLTTVAVPHPGRMFAVAATDNEQLALYDYIQLFLEAGAEEVIAADDFACLERLYARWSPGWQIPEETLAAMKARMAIPGVTNAALEYYRQAADVTSDIGLRSSALFHAPINSPTLAVAGVDDGCNLLRTMRAALIAEDFPAGVSAVELDGAGHFAHQERADGFNDLLLDWLASHRISR